jgi:hypothetical protein
MPETKTTRMKMLSSKQLLFPFVLAVLCCVTASAKVPSPFVSTDHVLVMQKIVDLQPLQALYAKNADGSFKGLYIMQHGVSFPADMSVSHENKPVVFIDKGLATSGTVAGYFLFNQFEVQEDKAWVNGVYYFDQHTSTPKTEVFTITLQKANGNWEITESKIERRDI